MTSKAKDLLGKLVQPKLNSASRALAAFLKGEFGIITAVEFEPELSTLYIDILVGGHIIEREYSSVSQFWQFWDDRTPRKP